MTPERKVKKKVTDLLKQHGVYYFFPVTGGYGVSGVPDIVACIKGKFWGVECKAGDNIPTPLQEAQLSKIRDAGGKTYVVNERTFMYFKMDIEHAVQEKPSC